MCSDNNASILFIIFIIFHNSRFVVVSNPELISFGSPTNAIAKQLYIICLKLCQLLMAGDCYSYHQYLLVI